MRNTDHAKPDPKDRTSPDPSKERWRLRRLAIAAGVAILFGAAAANGCEDKSDPGSEPAVTDTDTDETTAALPHSVPSQTDTDEPTQASEPPEATSEATAEETSEATSAEASEETSEEPQEETDAGSFFAQFPAFDPVTESGSGDSVIKLPASQGTITASHDGSSNFALTVLDSDNAMSELPVNVIGSYEGTTAYGLDEISAQAASLEIVADGDWEITVAPVTDAPEFSDSQDAHGDGVYRYTGGSATWSISHDGEANFIVLYVSESSLGSEVLVNEIGSYGGTVPVTAGPGVVIVQADGDWSLAPS